MIVNNPIISAMSHCQNTRRVVTRRHHGSHIAKSVHPLALYLECHPKIKERSPRKAKTISGERMCDTQSFFFISFYREKAGDTTGPNESLAANADVDVLPAHKPMTSGFSAFSTAGLMDEIPDDDDG